MAPSAGRLWFNRRWSIYYALIIFLCIRSAYAQCCNPPQEQQELQTHQQIEQDGYYFTSARVFDTVPAEGVSLLSTNILTETYLLDGETDEILYSYVFMSPTGSVVTDYSISFSCNNTLLFNDSTCVIFNVETAITGSTETAYNITVACNFNQFPGATDCNLIATSINSALRTTSRQFSSLDHTLFLPKSPAFYPLSNVLSNPQTTIALNHPTSRQTTQYTSPIVTVIIYGYVFYIPDQNGALSSDAVIVSGSNNVYTLPNYDRSDAGVRQIQSFAYVPGSSSVTGSLDFLNSATLSTTSSDVIFRYDPQSCSFINGSAEFQPDGSFALNDSDTCGMGLAVRDESSYPTLGVQFRPYKSGNFTLQLSWPNFGTSDEDYTQTLTFKIVERAPPVVVEVSKLDEYLSIPCGVQYLNLTVTNVRLASLRQVLVFNEDNTTTVWSEVPSFDPNGNYNSEEDWSTFMFESAGGLGNDVSFNITALQNSETLNGVVVEDGVETLTNLTLSFSSPPSLTSMSPSSTELSGGDNITLTGLFERFESSGSIFIGGYQLDDSQVSIDGTNQISFISPAQQFVGNQFVYNVTVRICAERSNALTLTYISQPSVTIIAISANYDAATQLYTVSQSSDPAFIADVSGNSDGITYAWQVLASDGSEVSLGADVPTTSQRLTFSPSLLSTTETYELNATVTNSLGLSSSQTIRFQIAQAGLGYVFVKVHKIGTLYRSDTVPTLVQATLYSSVSSAVTLVWLYRNVSYIAQYDVNTTTSIDSGVTGPTKFGLEFYITKTDLVIGNTILSLTASLNSDPTVTSTDNTTIIVVPTDLQAKINDGINGTLVQNLNDISITGANSIDPDILSGEGSSTTGISYSWNWCFKSLDPLFLDSVSNCSSLLPADQTVQSFTVSNQSLFDERLDTENDPDPTFFSFGLRVSKDTRSTDAFLYFDFRTVVSNERVPTLTALDVVDRTGSVVNNDEFSTTSEIIIRPLASDSNIQWAFDMVHARQRYLFSQAGILLTSNGFVSVRNLKTRMLLGFARDTLDPGTEYIVSVVASANDTSLETSYQIGFKTSDIPTLTCIPPSVTEAIVSETELIISAELSFDAPNVEFCFFLVDENRDRFSVGKGCSSLTFASFTFPREGIYDVECSAKTLSGIQLEVEIIDANITISFPQQESTTSQIQILSGRLANYTANADRCEVLRDHSCISSIIIATNDLSLLVEELVANDTSEEAVQLQESMKGFVQRLSELSQELAINTIFKPNQLEDSIDESFYLATISSQFMGDEATLYRTLSQLDGALGVVVQDGTTFRSNDIVEKVIGTVNVTLSNAYAFGDIGTTRRRLLQSIDERPTYADLMIRSLNYVAEVRRQQEGCGYIGKESTKYPDALVQRVNGLRVSQSVLEPCEVNIIIACDEEQIQETFGEYIQAELCTAAIDASDRSRVEGIVTEIPSGNVLKTGMVSHVDVYTEEMAYVRINGVNNIPDECIRLMFRRDTATLETTQYDNLTAGIVQPTSTTSGQGCTSETCFNYTVIAAMSVIFESLFITISTSNEGLITAGNYTRAPNTRPYLLEGEGVGIVGAFSRFIMPLVIFAALAGVATWFMVTRGVVAYPEVDDLGWEYVERDMFGRGSVETTSFSPVADAQDVVGSTFTNMAKRQSVERQTSLGAQAPAE